MNISKINSASFNGRLIIEDKNRSYDFDAEHITRIVDDMDKKETHIHDYCDYGNYDAYLSIPYSVIPPSKIIAAYTAANNSFMNDGIFLKNTKGKCTFVG